MGMHEIDTLIVDATQLILHSDLDPASKRNLIRNLESIPGRHKFDAGGFTPIERDEANSYEEVHIYIAALEVVRLAKRNAQDATIYHWCAFVLNNWDAYFRASAPPLPDLKAGELGELRNIYRSVNPALIEPMHATLTMYPEGMDWFSEDQNALIRWFCRPFPSVSPSMPEAG